MDERRRLARAASPLFGRIGAGALQPRGGGPQPGRAQHATLRRCDVGRAGGFEPDHRGMRQRFELFTLRSEHSELSVPGDPRRLLKAQRRQQPDRGHCWGRDRCQSGDGRALGQFGPWSRRNGIHVRGRRLAAGHDRRALIERDRRPTGIAEDVEFGLSPIPADGQRIASVGRGHEESVGDFVGR